MNLLKELTAGHRVFPTAIFELTNDTMVIASFEEIEAENKILLMNPMLVFINEQESGEDAVTLEPYMHKKLVETQNFYISKDRVFSVHMPSDGMFIFYMSRLQTFQNISNAPSSNPKNKKKAKDEKKLETANTDGNVIKVDFKNRKSANSVVNIYKESDLPTDDPGAA